MAVIKIDDELYNIIKKLIKEGNNRFDYPTVKAFVDKAVFSTIKELEGRGSAGKKTGIKKAGNKADSNKADDTGSKAGKGKTESRGRKNPDNSNYESSDTPADTPAELLHEGDA